MLYEVITPIPAEMLRANDLLYYPIADQLAYAQSNAGRNCFMLKVFPVVRWDTSVVHCSNLTFPVLGASYLDKSLPDLLAQRRDNHFCDTCMDHRITSYNVCYTKLLRGDRQLDEEPAMTTPQIPPQLDQCKLIDLPKIHDPRGNLIV